MQLRILVRAKDEVNTRLREGSIMKRLRPELSAREESELVNLSFLRAPQRKSIIVERSEDCSVHLNDPRLLIHLFFHMDNKKCASSVAEHICKKCFIEYDSASFFILLEIEAK